jgi:hypothetical protein
MTAVAWAVVCLGVTVLLAAIGDLVSEEIRGWLDLAPRAILRLAASQLDPAQRETIYRDEWLPELTYALRGAESRPITRLIRGVAYAMGLLIAARRIARRVDRAVRGWAWSTAWSGEVLLSVTNGTGRAITIESLGLTLGNGNTLGLPGSVPEDIRERVMIEVRQHGLRLRSLEWRYFNASESEPQLFIPSLRAAWMRQPRAAWAVWKEQLSARMAHRHRR